MVRKKHVSFVNVLAASLVAGAMMMGIWQGYDPKVFVFLTFNLAIAEMFVQMRWRLSMTCRSCGFDPVLYLREPLRAAEKVRIRLDQRRTDPRSLLSRPLDLPTIPAKRAEELRVLSEKQGRDRKPMLSRTVE